LDEDLVASVHDAGVSSSVKDERRRYREGGNNYRAKGVHWREPGWRRMGVSMFSELRAATRLNKRGEVRDVISLFSK
jgi:hypothetical protein